jgi:hypothetical protein
VQALERTLITTNWIAILLVFLLVCVFLLKRINANRLKGNVFSIVSNNFVETEMKDDNSFYKPFEKLIFLFSTLVLSLVAYKIVISYVDLVIPGFYTFLKIFTILFLYFLVKWFLEFLFSVLFSINNEVRYFLVSKSSYLYSISFLLFVAIILEEYSKLNLCFLVYFAVLLLFLRFVFHLANNKKLIFSKLFYFILYLCAFEIAPLFILFKLLF